MRASPSTDKFVQSEIDESRRVMAWLLDEPIPDPIEWIAPGVPSTIYAIEVLAPKYGIKFIEIAGARRHESEAKWHVMVKCLCKPTNRQVIGAAIWEDLILATQFAWRNAIRQLIPQ